MQTQWTQAGLRALIVGALSLWMVGCGGESVSSAEPEISAEARQLQSAAKSAELHCLAPALASWVGTLESLQAQMLQASAQGLDPEATRQAMQAEWQAEFGLLLAELQQALLLSLSSENACAQAENMGAARPEFALGNPFQGTQLATFGAALDALALANANSALEDTPPLTLLLVALTQSLADLLIGSGLNQPVATILAIVRPLLVYGLPTLQALLAFDAPEVARLMQHFAQELIAALTPAATLPSSAALE